MFQLDTDVIIYHLRKQQPLQAKWLHNAHISVITLAELLYGAQKSSHPVKSTKIVKSFIQDFSIQIILVSPEIVEEYAKQKVYLEKKGNSLDDFDLLIGATAIQKKATLVTNNTKHFSRMKNIQLT